MRGYQAGYSGRVHVATGPTALRYLMPPVAAMCELAANAGFVRLFARTKKSNVRSQAVLERAGFAIATLDDLSEEQVRTFAQKWFDLAFPGDPGGRRGRVGGAGSAPVGARRTVARPGARVTGATTLGALREQVGNSAA